MTGEQTAPMADEDQADRETPALADEEVTRLQQELEASRANEQLAVQKLRAALIAAEPALEESMLEGETLAEVEASYAKARTLLEHLRTELSRHGVQRVPAGAPGRVTRRPITAFEKIRDGLAKR